VLADLEGKGRRIRTVAVPIWVKQGIEAWTAAAGIDKGRLLRSVSKSGKVNRHSLSDWAVWSVVEQSSKQIGIEHFESSQRRDRFLTWHSLAGTKRWVFMLNFLQSDMGVWQRFGIMRRSASCGARHNLESLPYPRITCSASMLLQCRAYAVFLCDQCPLNQYHQQLIRRRYIEFV
jgi:hypothetical protein